MPANAKLLRLLAALLCIASGLALLRSTGLPQRAAFSGFLLPDLRLAAPELGAAAPIFSLKTAAGRDFTLERIPGRATVISFWASYCAPCRAELAHLQDLYASQPGSLRVIAINLGESRATAVDWAADLGLSFDVLLDPRQRVGALYRVRGLPSAFLLDENLRIRRIIYGAMSQSRWQRAIDALVPAG